MTYAAVSAGTSTLDFCDTLGPTPPVPTLVVEAGGLSHIPVQSGGSVTFMPGSATQFLRGDVNGGGSVNLSDGVFQLQWLFGSGPAGTCEEAADTNGNGQLDGLQDPILLFNYLFLNGPAPEAPFPTCDTTTLFLGCSASPCP